MSQRASGYERQAGDRYETPPWVTQALLPHMPRRIKTVWEPACGTGKIVKALRSTGLKVYGTDIERCHDFLKMRPPTDVRAVITNPPFGLAEEFIEHALWVTSNGGFVAMLLRTDYDHARTRAHLFAHKAFAKKLVLTKRIIWFERPGAAPSFNHAWFIWDWRHRGVPTLAYYVEDQS